MLFVLAGVVYLGANSTKLGLEWGEPSAISKKIPAQTTTQTTTPTTSNEITSEEKVVSFEECRDEVEAYCWDRYGMTLTSNPDGINRCVDSMMNKCDPSLKERQWSFSQCQSIHEQLIAIGVEKHMYSGDYSSSYYQGLMNKEYNLDQDFLYHCKDYRK